MAKGDLWVWQFDTDYFGDGEADARGVIRGDDGQYPFIRDVYLKTHQSKWWMCNLYDHPLAPCSKDNLSGIRDIYANQGIGLVPWCVPSGWYPTEEADLANEVIDVCGSLILDVEPYAWFWTGPWENLHEYMQRIRDRHPDAWIGLSFDPRYGQYGPWNVDKYADIHFDEWLSYVDGLLPQDYWNTFQVDPVWEIEHTWARIGDIHKDVVFAIPGHDADSDKFRRGLEAALERAEVSIWRRGVFTVANADVLERAEQPNGNGRCAELLAECQARVGELERQLAMSEAQVANLKTVMRQSATLADAVAQALRTNAG